MWDFKSADAEAVKGRKNYIVIVFKDKMNLSELTPELNTYRKLNLCIHANENIDMTAARIRYTSFC